ncbi:hypothetical protein EDC01DRAFT_645179 [Geopyxis carbonaria]|nr:hypothetical protein EDC01DRAFT_645179 [Geopyxis carbonaria]
MSNSTTATELELLRAEVAALKELVKQQQNGGSNLTTEPVEAEVIASVAELIEGKEITTEVPQAPKEATNEVPKPLPEHTGIQSKVIDLPEPDRTLTCTGDTIDAVTRKWLDTFNFDLKMLNYYINTQRDQYFFQGVDRAKVMPSLVEKLFNDTDIDRDVDLEKLAEFVALAGPENEQMPVTVRDFQDMHCREGLEFKVQTDEELWKLLSRPREKGSKKESDRRLYYEKVAICPGLNEDGEGEFPVYGREIYVGQITPNIALALLCFAIRSPTPANARFFQYLGRNLDCALSTDTSEIQSYADTFHNYKRATYCFSAVFLEIIWPPEDATVSPVKTLNYPKPTGTENFGSDLCGKFAPSKPDSPDICESVISLTFDCLVAESGTYWTLISLGEYTEDSAYMGKPNLGLESAERYSSPEELFLDKLARVIDTAVDDGMMGVMDVLKDYLDLPVRSLFNQEESEQLLFDNARFTRTKKYHWALTWLGKLQLNTNSLLAAIDDVENTLIPKLRAEAQEHRKRTGQTRRGQELVSEANFRRKHEQAKKVYRRILEKQEEVKDLRDALVNASGVLQSRAAVSQAETVYILTILMIIYLPVTLVIGTFSMSVLPTSSQTLQVFGITMGIVVVVTTLLGINLGSIITIISKNVDKLRNTMHSSMANTGGSWGKRSNKLKISSEAERIVERDRELRIPVAWYYTWYSLVWLFIVFPATELISAGGLKHITARAGTKGARWAWDVAAVPLRMMLLPLHAVLIVVDYVIFVIMGAALVGRNDRTSTDTEPVSKPWTTRFTDPFRIFSELASPNSPSPSPPPPTKGPTATTDLKPSPSQSHISPESPDFYSEFKQYLAEVHAKNKEKEEKANGKYEDNPEIETVKTEPILEVKSKDMIDQKIPIATSLRNVKRTSSIEERDLEKGI